MSKQIISSDQKQNIHRRAQWITKYIAKQNKQLMRELIEQLKHEEMKITPSGRESFDHPTGRHNILGITWKLLIHGCIQMGLNVIDILVVNLILDANLIPENIDRLQLLLK
jgi:hypothetical protein